MKSTGNPAGLRKFLRPLIWVLGMGIAALLTVAIVYLSAAKSNPSGKRIIKGVGDSVVITFDESDIPHIKANSQADALFALVLDTFMPQSVPGN